MININQRLKRVSTYVTGDTLADIGSDHAYLPIYLIQNQHIKRAIAGEVIHGPLKAAEDNIASYGLTSSISARLGNGLAVIDPSDDVDCITICGMGGPLIADILNNGASKLVNHPRLVLQSNIQSEPIRRTLNELNYKIVAEALVEEKGYIYEIIVADQGEMTLSDEAYKFGPELLQEKDALFYKKWERELQALKRIQAQLNEASHQERLAEITAQIKQLEEVLR
ncbi:tRNA (adenine(22)-N(1))-methyltransferase TrmK [Staphylococcus massiliensis]|uniref:tRNA (adenine(22)-N(1))-methyltransferase n=1 Tax=Staphylococcus massiliensis TaxID=555791 RepID=UPI001EE10A35|nr:tRNA (adenine(22)-N(1))-methyltransferase TrmK [Staphylococcus massiliensis]MCG3412533.1 tRNA (adenine(22)-N(1))-methyltransferase TrmK [Staphylococcus massiliensis]